MIEAMWGGLLQVLTWKIMGLICLATVVGNFFGAMPGMGGNLALALLIPFVFGMDPFTGLALLLAMHSVVQTGGAIPGILFAVPGTGPCVATIIDGHEMTKQGRGGQALGAALVGSMVGGVIGAVVLVLLIPVIQPITMAFGSAEIFMLIVFGLTFIVVISRENIAKGFASALMGLLLGTVGLGAHTGVGRYTFGQLWLWDGINIVTIVLGLFAFAETLTLGARGRKSKITDVNVEISFEQIWEGSVAVFKEWWLTLRTSVIGCCIGVIPGLGGDAASWICYGHAAQTCKNNETFGKGDIRGVIGVETANNSKEAGALLPTLAFGIPGSSGMAILLGAFLILGLVPGPTMISEHLDMVWGMVWVLVISNIIGTLTLLPLARYMGNLVFIRSSLMIPGIMVLSGVGAFLIRGYWQDVVLSLVFGVFGYGMKRFKFPRAPLILGFIMGELAEEYLHKTLDVWGWPFMMRPVVLVLLSMVVLSLGYTGWKSYQEAKEMREATIS